MKEVENSNIELDPAMCKFQTKLLNGNVIFLGK